MLRVRNAVTPRMGFAEIVTMNDATKPKDHRARSAWTRTPELATLLWVGLCLSPAVLAAEAPGDAGHAGATLYRQLCVGCHGPDGQGVDDHEPLYGKRSLNLLARRIERTMPKDEEDLCVGEDAQAVADYIYHAFYSAEARARRNAVRRDLVRLTVPQLRTSVADLVGHFMPGTKDVSPDERGLKTRYRGRHLTKKEEDGKEAQRHSFDHGLSAPMLQIDRAGLEALELTPESETGVTWSGSIIAEETGEYEFVIRTRNGVRLWINETSERSLAFIDGWVTSTKDVRQEKGRIFLLGGRPHPLRLRLSISPKDDEGLVELLWKPPHGPLEPVPQRRLAPQTVAPVMVVSTAFPPDDASYGFERGTAVSQAWLEAVTKAAIETADFVSDRLATLAKPGSKETEETDREAEVKAFLARFAEIAFRRPLPEWQRRALIDGRFAGESLQHATKLVVLQVLSSPHFLYPELPGEEAADAWTVAARLALTLWDSLPDEVLRNAARQGRLTEREDVFRQAHRMLEDPRARIKMQGFFHQWLELDRAEGLSKDSEKFPGFDQRVIADLRVSLDLFLESVVWSERSDYRELLLADYLILNNRLAEFYAEGGTASEFQRVTFHSGKRAGVLTHPLLLSSHAYHDKTSPIHRGVFLVRNILGLTMKPPPEAIEFKDAEFDPGMTMREKVTRLTRPKACMACHVMINPLGFSLEGFDAIGRRQERDNKSPVDTAGAFVDGRGETINITGARDLAEFVATSPDAQRAFVRHLFHHAVKHGTAVYGVDTEQELHRRFVASDFSIRELLADIAGKVALHGIIKLDKTDRVAGGVTGKPIAKHEKE